MTMESTNSPTDLGQQVSVPAQAGPQLKSQGCLAIDTVESQRLPYRSDIDGLRAVAVIGVVLYHAFPTLAPGGFSGVDIFFVISGYLISGVIFKDLAAGTFSTADFYAHRIRRIFPALALVLVASWVLAWYLLIPTDFVSFAKAMLGGVGFYANFVQVGGGYFESPEQERPLLHLWSLGVEEQFYLVWPLLLWGTWRWRRSALPALIAVVMLASFLDNIFRAPVAPKLAFYFPDPRLWELAIGGGLAFLMSRGVMVRLRWKWLLSFVGAAALLVSIFFLNARMAWPGWWALFPTVGTAMVLTAGPVAGLNRMIFASRPAVAIGRLSYPWYLWHWPLLVFGHVIPWGLEQVWIDGLSVVASLGLAAATYQFLERPIRFGSRLTARTRTLGPLAAMTAPAVLAFVVLAGRGLPGRFPESIQSVLTAPWWETEGIQYYKCFDRTATAKRLELNDCIDAKSSSDDRRPLVLLWGDSHAFALYPGLRNLQRQQGGFRLAIFTKGSCPIFAGPGIADTPAGCLDFNTQVREEIRRLKPDVVVLDAYWASRRYFRNGVIDGDAIQKALLSLESDGIPRLVVVGTVPTWTTSLPRVIFREALRNAGDIPERSVLGLDNYMYVADATVRQAVGKTSAVYVPVLDKLCTTEGCLLMADRERRFSLQSDRSHLTVAGSRLVIERIVSEILGTAQ